MIETIIKRNGTEEPLIPHKINGWGEWGVLNLDVYVDWSSIVLETVGSLPTVVSSQVLQEHLIKTTLDQDGWSPQLFAGRLFAIYLQKKIHGDSIPSVKELHEKLHRLGFMVKLNYSDEEYAQVESWIDHSRDTNCPHFALKQVREKYSLQNRVTKEEYETQQFVYMRMAMALAEDQPAERRMQDVYAFYEHFSHKRINAPTPNYVNLGTKLRGYASCCVFTTEDDARSLAIGDHIAYIMTCMSAGIGSFIKTRSIGDAVRGGLIKHKGKYGYYAVQDTAVHANLQNGRGGALTTHNNSFDPEIESLTRLKNPRSTEDKQIRGLDYSFSANRLFDRKAAKNEDVFTFNCFTAPDLFDAFYGKDIELFESLYAKYEADESFPKNWVSAREILLVALNEAFETGRHYETNIEEMNRHTPFKDPIYSSNLCQEIALPTKGYVDMRDLYSEEDHGRGEVGMCSLGGIVISNIENDAQYQDAMYYTLLMIDKCIHLSDYALPHIGVTAKARMSAGVGIMGYAHYLARKGIKYSTQEGKEEHHRVAEKHMYFAIEASLRLGKELGNAPWMHKTLWPEGWMPIDTYNRNVDQIVAPVYQFDWEDLRSRVVANGGIRNSVLVAYMPGESSSKASGTTNSIYPIRDLNLLKSDNGVVMQWSAPEGEKLADAYEFAWNIETIHQIHMYAIFQKFTDQGISADMFRRLVDDEKVSSQEMLRDRFNRTKFGLKSKYYQNVLTTDGTDLTIGTENVSAAAGCGSAGCTL